MFILHLINIYVCKFQFDYENTELDAEIELHDTDDSLT